MGCSNPDEDRLLREEGAPHGLPVAMPEFLSGDAPPNCPFESAPKNPRIRVVEPNDSLCAPPQRFTNCPVVAVSNPGLATCSFYNKAKKLLGRLGLPVRPPMECIEFDQRTARGCGERLRERALAGTARSDNDDPGPTLSDRHVSHVRVQRHLTWTAACGSARATRSSVRWNEMLDLTVPWPLERC